MKTQQMPPKVSNQAVKRINGMMDSDKTRIKQAILEIPNGNIKPLQGVKGSFRLRVGKWRIIFSWINDRQVFIEKIDTRGQAYKGA
jgi:mRNA interferase RelE/StbE